MRNSGFLNKQIENFDAYYEQDENTVYYGFCQPGTTSKAESKWAILRHTLEDGIITQKWANGSQTMNNSFTNLSSKTYKWLTI